MDNVLRTLESSLQEHLTWFTKELRGIRSGRPSTELVEDIMVEYAGATLPVKQLGSLSVVPPREIRISVWDKEAVPTITKAIEDAQSGLSVSNDGATVRATLSPLSTERVEELSKLVRKHAEEARISIRNDRDDAVKQLKGMQEKKEISEDQLFQGKEKIQKKVDGANRNVEEALESKLKQLQE